MVKSLLALCASKIVTDFQMTKEAVGNIPKELFQVLLEVAVQNSKTPATRLLVSSWPHQVLNVKKIVTWIPQAVKSEIMVTILKTVAESASCLAKVVDLRDIKLNIYQTEDCFQALIISFTSRLHSSPCKVIFDWAVGEQNFAIVSKVMGTFPEGSGVEVLCGKLKAEGLSPNRLIKLITFLNKDVVQQLDLRLNSLGNEGMLILLPHVKQLKNVELLDISYNIVDLTRDVGGSLLKCIKDVFRILPKLQKLGLSFNRITGKLSEIVSSLHSPVRELMLDHCFLSSGDKSYLANTMDFRNLEVLDISGNNFSNHIWNLENVLLRSGPSLIDLSLDAASLSHSELSVNMLKRVAKSFKKLERFSIQFNGFIREELVALVTAYASIPSLTLMQITDQRDHLGMDESDEAYNLALMIGGVPYDLSDYRNALNRIGVDMSKFSLEIRDSETGDLFAEPPGL